MEILLCLFWNTWWILTTHSLNILVVVHSLFTRKQVLHIFSPWKLCKHMNMTYIPICQCGWLVGFFDHCYCPWDFSMRQVLGPDALGRHRGIRWRGRWERGSGWGIHVNPWLIHVNVWQKPLQYCKVISLQLIKINGKKKKENTKRDHSCLVRTLSFFHLILSQMNLRWDCLRWNFS